jgi:hypothetical protein
VSVCEALIAIAKPKNSLDTIMIEKGQNNGANHVVQTGTQSAAGDNSTFEFGWIEIYFFPGAGQLKVGRLLSAVEVGLYFGEVVVVEHMAVIPNKLLGGHGARYSAVSERLNGQIQIFVVHGQSPREEGNVGRMEKWKNGKTLKVALCNPTFQCSIIPLFRIFTFS